jgi:predicted heme/steroid binding protein
MDVVTYALILFVIFLVYNILKAWKESRKPPPPEAKWMIGDITQHSLRFYNGMDWSKPTLIAVKGKVYDVTNSNADLYGPGKPTCLESSWARAPQMGGEAVGHSMQQLIVSGIDVNQTSCHREEAPCLCWPGVCKSTCQGLPRRNRLNS